jgi:SAM-dependent methyltransferase/diadenosine tetraphosphate (Ap4A) HIT family hydrolase
MKIAKLKKLCIFCHPRDHMQEGQILLRTDNFYLFAGIGPIVEGYIIIAPHTCDRKRGGLRTISEASPDLLDELIFLRGIVTKFYREVYDFEGGLFFEHGRAGTCGVSDTPHCYHAHLCCFPVSKPIWKDIKIPGKRVLQLAGLGEFSATVDKNPHLLIQECIINEKFSPETAGRESWETRAVVLDDESNVPRQYLRKLLATRVGTPDLWDWAAAPGFPEVKSLCIKFGDWLQKKTQLPVRWRNNNVPHMRFLEGVRVVNAQAYDSIAHEFHSKWGDPAACMVGVMKEFIEFIIQSRRQFGGEEDPSRVKLLDAGCGPAIHLDTFREACFDCLGIDSSKEMLGIAARKLAKIKPLSAAPHIKLRRRDAFNLNDFHEQYFDAIWFSALMVHLPRRFAQATINDLFRILRPGGILYISAQSGGDAVFRRDGRFFVYYAEAELEDKFRDAGFKVLKSWDDKTYKGTCGDRRTKYWRNYFLTRPR